MSWIDERISQRKARLSRCRDIEEQAPILYDALWRKIFDYVEEAKTKGFDLITNGAGFRRVVKLPDARLILEMPGSLDRIMASGSVFELQFLLDIGKDGVVNLENPRLPNGRLALGAEYEIISIDQAAILILDRFLFPELNS